MSRTAPLIAVLLLLGVHTILCKAPIGSDRTGVLKVSICEVIKSPRRFDSKVVEVSGQMMLTFEGTTMFDPSCHKSADDIISVSADLESDAACKTFYDRIEHLGEGDILDGILLRKVVVRGRLLYRDIGGANISPIQIEARSIDILDPKLDAPH